MTTKAARTRKPTPPPQPEAPPITLRGVRTHNLKGIDCDIPAGRLTVVTGVSGSGKSSLAFDTLYAEGQRRYVESLSTYARQFLARMARPDADSIDHIPPAIALEQKNTVRNARSTVGTATEINDYLRLLFGRAGEVFCANCGTRVRADSPQSACDALLARGEGAKLVVLAPVAMRQGGGAETASAKLRRQGYDRVWIDGAATELDELDASRIDALETVDVVIDRVVAKDSSRSRLATAVEAAFQLAGGRCAAVIDGGARLDFNRAFACNACGAAYREPEPTLFNFNNPLGACPECQGFGRITGIDWGKVIPNPSLSIDDGCIACWNGETGREMYDYFARFNGKEFKIAAKAPFRDLPPEQQSIIKFGKGKWPGVSGYFKWLEETRYKVQSRIMIARYRSFEPCGSCGGARIGAAGRAVRFGGAGFGDLCSMSVGDLADWFGSLKLPAAAEEALERPLSAVRARLAYLNEVGLSYLTLARATRTLSGGEAQRINLATALGSALTETLYVLDEPTVGLHPVDTDRLVRILRSLVELGNTVVLVEHDLEVMREADWLLDIGPEAGERGGRLLFQGTPKALLASPGESVTAKYLDAGLAGRRRGKPAKDAAAEDAHGRRKPTGWITVEGAEENNLRNLTVRLPLGVLGCLSGVSGSGKSTLLKACLYGNYRRERGDTDVETGRVARIAGLDRVADMVLVDQSPLSRSTRSNAATYLKAYDQIRALLAATREAKARGLKPGDFSFNVPGGRCETCEGTGTQTVEMLFLADVEVTCEKCDGARFQERVLDIRWKEKNVNEILAMTVREALAFFAGDRKIEAGLKPLADVGLGYLRLGQSTSTLSGGEAQRLKIAGHLAAAEKQRGTLLLFDEPTTGLHPSDLETLLEVFDRLLESGFSLLVIEHHLEFLRRADYIVDMGPGGGKFGGRVVAEGTPEQVAAVPESVTGRYLLQAARGGKV
ncbi:MAG: excinuclease ABC subunit UvrA [Candidatus Sumerlaeia bacterium]|nr:excinuclease ABC subunit UvrA [Candidatus Sumerlaeia bacterium]